MTLWLLCCICIIAAFHFRIVSLTQASCEKKPKRVGGLGGNLEKERENIRTEKRKSYFVFGGKKIRRKFACLSLLLQV